jgi:hypothetical protein
MRSIQGITVELDRYTIAVGGIAWEYASANNNDCFIEAHIGILIYKRYGAFSKICIRKRHPGQPSTTI